MEKQEAITECVDQSIHICGLAVALEGLTELTIAEGRLTVATPLSFAYECLASQAKDLARKLADLET